MVSMMLNNFPHIILTSPGAIAFHIGSLTIRWYGVFIAIAFLIAYFIAENLIKKKQLNLECFNDLILLILIFSIFFARLWFVILSWDYFKNNLTEIPMIWLGGQSIHGGIFGAIFATLMFSKIRKVSFYAYIDVIAVVTPLGQAIGRWGNFFNNEAFGRPVQDHFFIPIWLNIPIHYRPEKYLSYKFFHPTFLYESFFDLILFVFLYRNCLAWSNRPGKCFWFYLFGYSIIRFFLEFIRVDSLYLFGTFSSAHVISVVILILSGIMLCSKSEKQK